MTTTSPQRAAPPASPDTSCPATALPGGARGEPRPSFFAQLDAAAARNESLLCIGLDPDPDRLPARLRALPPAEAIVAFNREIIAATADLVACYKPNLAFYEALGPQGLVALRQTLALVPPEVPTIGDAKRGDIANTMRAYARALFDVYGFGAVTASPYLGRDALEPLLARADRGVYVLCLTSNPGAAEVAEVRLDDGRPLFLAVAERVRAWNTNQNAGLVVGATHPEQLAQVRRACPELPILVPGTGAQGGDLERSVQAGLDGRRAGLLVVAARQVLYASGGDDFAQEARRVAQALRDRINRAR